MDGRYFGAHDGAAARRRVDYEASVDQLHALAHPHEAEAAARLALLEPASVVADCHPHCAVRLHHLDLELLRLRVLGDVVDGLLNEAIDGALDLSEEARGRPAAVEGEIEAGLHVKTMAGRN